MRGACDICAASSKGDFNPSNTLSNEGGQITCGDFVEENNLDNLEQESIICISAGVAGALFCCGEGLDLPEIQCPEEVGALSECMFPQSEDECCEGPPDIETQAPASGNPGGGWGFPDYCDLIDKSEISSATNAFKQCCSGCASEIEAWGACLKKSCDGSGHSSSTVVRPQHTLFFILFILLVRFML